MAQKIHKQTPEQRNVVARALELQELLGYKTAADFVREQLVGISESRWGRIRDDKYPGNPDHTVDQLQQAINRMELFLARKSMQGSVASSLADEFYLLPLFKSVEGAVARAMNEKGQDRLVMCPWPTGGGKTAMCEHLRKQYGAKVIHAALPSYRKNAIPFYRDLAAALGIVLPGNRRRAEGTVFEALNKHDGGLLCIDEGNNFGGECIDVLKAILNTTRWSVAFFCTPQHFRNMMAWYWDRTDQLLRRVVAIIELDEIKAADVRPFMEPLNLNGSLREACMIVAEAANEFGHFDLCHRVTWEMAEKDHHELEDVQKAVMTVRQRLRTAAMKANGERHAKRGRVK